MKTANSHPRKKKVRFLASVQRSTGLEVFLDLQRRMLDILCKRGKQGTSLTRSLKNAARIKVYRHGSRLTLSWHNGNEDGGRSTLEFRKRDRLVSWLQEHVIGRPHHRYGKSRKLRDSRREARRHKIRLREHFAQVSMADIIENLAEEFGDMGENIIPVYPYDHPAQAA